MDVQLKALSDQIAHIREVAVQNLEVLVKLFGEDWMQEYIMPSISDAAKRSGPSGYLGRITALHAVGALSAVMPPPFLCDVLLPQVLAFLTSTRNLHGFPSCGGLISYCVAFTSANDVWLLWCLFASSLRSACAAIHL